MGIYNGTRCELELMSEIVLNCCLLVLGQCSICLTSHWLDQDWVFIRALLDIYLCTDRHLGENICEWIKQVLNDNELLVCCVSFWILSVAFLCPVVPPRYTSIW